MKLTPLITLVSSLALCGAAQAATLLNTGFEAPEYTVGDVAGQNGWDVGIFADQDVPSATIQSAIVKSGSQALALTGTGVGAYAYKLTPYAPTTDKLVKIDFDMQWGTAGISKSAFYGAQAYDTEFNEIGSIGVTQVFGFYNAVVFDAEGLPITIPGAVVTLGTWNHFQLLLDYETQTFQGSMNGLLSPVMPFNAAGIVDFGETDFFRNIGLDEADDTAYFDNLSTVTSVVPEPASLGLMGGLAVLLLRRRA